MRIIKLSVFIVISMVLSVILSCLRENGNIKKSSNNSIQVIDLLSSPEYELTALSMVASDVTYIPLSTNEGSIFNFIEKIRINNGRFFMKVIPADIMCFNETGLFLFRLDMTGGGPEEYLYISDFDVSDDGKTLVLLSGNKIQFYTISDSGFSYSNTIKLKQPYPIKISFVPGTDKLLLSLPSDLGTEETLSFLIDNNGDTLSFKQNVYQYKKSESYNFSSSNDVIQYKSGAVVYFKEVWSDTIFSVSKKSNTFYPSLIFDSHGTVAKTDFRSDPVYSTNHSTDFSQVLGITEVNRYIFYDCFLMGERSMVLYDKSDQVKYSINRENLPLDDISGGPRFNFSRILCASNGLWYSSVDAIALKKFIQSGGSISVNPQNQLKYDQLKSIVDSINDTDNPVLIIVNPKE